MILFRVWEYHYAPIAGAIPFDSMARSLSGCGSMSSVLPSEEAGFFPLIKNSYSNPYGAAAILIA